MVCESCTLRRGNILIRSDHRKFRWQSGRVIAPASLLDMRLGIADDAAHFFLLFFFFFFSFFFLFFFFFFLAPPKARWTTAFSRSSTLRVAFTSSKVTFGR